MKVNNKEIDLKEYMFAANYTTMGTSPYTMTGSGGLYYTWRKRSASINNCFNIIPQIALPGGNLASHKSNRLRHLSPQGRQQCIDRNLYCGESQNGIKAIYY